MTLDFWTCFLALAGYGVLCLAGLGFACTMGRAAANADRAMLEHTRPEGPRMKPDRAVVEYHRAS